MLQNLGPVELIIIFAMILLIFGVGRVGRVGHELGTAINEFRRGVKGEDEPDAPEGA